MTNVSDAFLLEVAGIAASLLGFFVVGVFFFVQRGMFPRAAEHAQRYMQAATGSIIVLYGMTLVLSLALVVLPASWVSVMYRWFCCGPWCGRTRRSVAYTELLTSD